ncbi:hypothetical protein IAD21_01349 [Abditibacteriota bacterium]|nr:hypothetical protein IAD21_01349 [Abditibacteriota bacterium]
MISQDNILSLICAIPALVAGLTVHEFAHAWAADKLGDPTPRSQGRLTLDPVAHIDPFGALFFVVAWFSGFGLGWAKPVMTNPRNLHHPRRDSLLIAIAGPISNLMQLPIWFILVFISGFIEAKIGMTNSQLAPFAHLISRTFMYGVLMNAGLAAFNMIPIPPLDGHWVLQSLGGRPVELLFDQIRPYSFILLIVIINFTPIFHYTLAPVEAWAMGLAFQAQDAGMALAGR